MGEQDDLKLLAGLFEDKTVVPCNFDLASLWLLASACQLTCTHPGISSDLRARYRKMAKEFQTALALFHPETDHLFEAGWYRSRDVQSNVSTLAPTRNLPFQHMSKKRRRPRSR